MKKGEDLEDLRCRLENDFKMGIKEILWEIALTWVRLE
jgi:hypothetical protein